jgi:hypothetical protein
LETEGTFIRNIYPDIRIVGADPGRYASGRKSELAPDAGGVAVLEDPDEDPVVVLVPSEPITEGFIEIRDAASGNRVITVIEILSPANKAGGTGTAEYRRKQQEVLSGETSLVEIDLLRAGQWVISVPMERFPRSHRTTYRVSVRRGWQNWNAEIYRAPLQKRLPTVRIPLRPTDPDAKLDLQALIDQAYRMGRYDDIDYSRDPDPPLEDAEKVWVEGWLKEKGRR